MLDVGIWVSAILTIAVLTFIYRENPLSRIAEHALIAVTVGNIFVQAAKYAIGTLGSGDYFFLLLSFTLGALLYTAFSKKYSHLARWPTALLIGVGVGISLRATPDVQIIRQITATAVPLINTADFLATVNNILIFVIVTTVLLYFSYTQKFELKGRLSRVGDFARLAMMAAFGATFGGTVATRIAFLVSRLQFLLFDWLAKLFS